MKYIAYPVFALHIIQVFLATLILGVASKNLLLYALTMENNTLILFAFGFTTAMAIVVICIGIVTILGMFEGSKMFFKNTILYYIVVMFPIIMVNVNSPGILTILLITLIISPLMMTCIFLIVKKTAYGRKRFVN